MKYNYNHKRNGDTNKTIMKVILNVSKTGFHSAAVKYGTLRHGKVVYVYLERHDALIRKDLYYTYKAAGSFENFLVQIGDKI